MVQTNASFASPRFEDLFCAAFDSTPPETPLRSILDLFVVAAGQAGFSYPTKQEIAATLLDRREPISSRRLLPLTYHFFGNHDYYVRGRFHEGRVERDSWTGDVTWDEGTRVAFNARSRYDTFKVVGDVWTDGLEVFYGLDVAGLTTRKRRFSDLFAGRILTTDQARLVVPSIAHWGYPTVKVTEGLNLFGLGRSFLAPIPRTRVFTPYPDPGEKITSQPISTVQQNSAPKESFGRRLFQALISGWIDQDSVALRQLINEWLGGRSKWVQGPMGTLDDLQMTIDSRPPPNHELAGRSYLHLDWQKVIETLKSGRFLTFDFDGIHGDSYADFPKIPVNLLIPEAEGVLDLHGSYNPAQKSTSIVLSNIDLTLHSPMPMTLRGQVEVVLRHPNRAEIYLDNLEYIVENIETPQLGSLSSSGRLNSHIQVDLSGERPVFRKSWLDIDELTIGSADGGPIQFQLGETTTGALVEDGSVSFEYDPDRTHEPMQEEIELQGFAFSHGPKNNLDFSDLVVRVSSLLNLSTLKAEIEGNLRFSSERSTPLDVRGIRASLEGVPPTMDDGPRLRVALHAGSVPLFREDLSLESSGELWSEPRKGSCQMGWGGKLAFQNKPGAQKPVQLGTDFLGISDFESIWLKILPAFEQIFSDWTFRGLTEGEVRFKPEGKSAILESLKKDSSLSTVQRPAEVLERGEKIIEGLQCRWEGKKKEGSLDCRAGKVRKKTKVRSASLKIPWGKDRLRLKFNLGSLDRRYDLRGNLDYHGDWSFGQREVAFDSRSTGSGVDLSFSDHLKRLSLHYKTGIRGGATVPFDLRKGTIEPHRSRVGLKDGTVSIELRSRSMELVRGLDLVLAERGRIRGEEFQTDTIGGLCFSGLVNPEALELLDSQVELVQEDGKWFRLRRCGKRLPLTRKALVEE